MKNTLLTGNIAESLFELESARRGMDVFIPRHGGGPVDAIIHSAGRCLTVQIKSAGASAQRGKPAAAQVISSIRTQFSGCDVIAAYFSHGSRWVFFPSWMLSGTRAATFSTSETRRNCSPRGQARIAHYDLPEEQNGWPYLERVIRDPSLLTPPKWFLREAPGQTLFPFEQ